jgi:hypothetical protein
MQGSQQGLQANGICGSGRAGGDVVPSQAFDLVERADQVLPAVRQRHCFD